jgi:glycosyltransferase involved in cell wall biosynthesis
VGHFSRLSAWKGQHILLEALTHCPDDIVALLVGDALFGEQDYVEYLHELVAKWGLKQRVKFLGFRSDVPPLMAACDLIAHTSTAPEPFGRVIVEAMLCGRPIVAAAAGGAVELIEAGKTGWLVQPGDAKKLAEVMTQCRDQPRLATAIASQGQIVATQKFNLSTISQHISQLLDQVQTKQSG